MDPAPRPAPLPDLVLWRGDGCHLCDDALALVTLLLAERAATGLWTPAIVERRIADDPVAERAFIEQIPVLEIDGRRLPLAVRAGPVRAFLADVLDGRGAGVDGPEIPASPGNGVEADGRKAVRDRGTPDSRAEAADRGIVHGRAAADDRARLDGRGA